MVATGMLLRAGAAPVLALAVIVVSQVAPVVAQVQQPLAVLVEDHAFVTVHTMLIAREEAQRIYAAANVRLLWPGKKDRQAPSVRSVPRLLLIILAGDVANSVFPPAVDHLPLLARAAPAGRRAYVHYDRVTRMAGKYNAEPGVALGRVFAHELAHLLLGVDTHAASGVMTTQLELRGHPLFTTDEAGRVQSALAQLSEAVLAQGGTAVTTLSRAD